MSGKLSGKVAFVTGAARGQGRSHAIRLAQEGADVIAVDIAADIPEIGCSAMGTEADLKETATAIEALGRRVHVGVADVRNFDDLSQQVNEGIASLGAPDVVVANAGVLDFGSAWEISDSAWDAVVDVNLKGVWHTCKAAIPSMIEADKGGSIILISSTAGTRGLGNMAHYVAAKHGVVGLMKALAGELAPHMIRVNSVHPTNVDTYQVHNPKSYSMFFPDDLSKRNREGIQEAMRGFNMLPIAWLDPSDVSNMVAFLASDEARYITASQMKVDAGSTEGMIA